MNKHLNNILYVFIPWILKHNIEFSIRRGKEHIFLRFDLEDKFVHHIIDINQPLLDITYFECLAKNVAIKLLITPPNFKE